jgi:hypothetical protein
MLNSFKKMMPLLKDIHDDYFFIIMSLVINVCRKKLTKMEANKMKKIIFSKLWKHNTYSKVKSICFQDKRFGNV